MLVEYNFDFAVKQPDTAGYAAAYGFERLLINDLISRYHEQIEYAQALEQENKELCDDLDASRLKQRALEKAMAALRESLTSPAIRVGHKDYNAGYRHGVRDATEGALRALIETIYHKENQV